MVKCIYVLNVKNFLKIKSLNVVIENKEYDKVKR